MIGTMDGYERSAQLYDLFDTKDNVDFFLHYAAEAGTILEVGAGTGRIAIPLAEQGIRAVCVEPSPAMRREFRKKLNMQRHLRDLIEIVPGDAASFTLEHAFPVVLLSGVFDHFLDRRERLTSLENIVRHLEADGMLVFDLFLGLMTSSSLSPAGRVRIGDREVRRLVGRQMMPGKRVKVQLVFEIYRNAYLVDRVDEESVVGITTREEVHGLLSEVECCVRREFSDYDFTPYRDGDDLLIVEAAHQPSVEGSGDA